MKNLSERSCLYYRKTSNIEKVEIIHVLHNKVTLLMRRRSEQGTRNCHKNIFRNVLTMYIENVNQKIFFYDSDEIEIRLPFYRSFSTFGNIFGIIYTEVFYSSA